MIDRILSSLLRCLSGRSALPECDLPTLQNAPSPRVEVDWTQAPDAAIEWIYDERARVGRWLNGRHRVEEFGIVWEWAPAPSFGATRKTRVRKTSMDEAQRQAAALDVQTAVPLSASPPRRL